MRKLFADTFYFLALLNKNDEAHQKASHYSSLIDKLIRTEWVLVELADALASSRHRAVFQRTRDELFGDTDANVVPFETHLYEEGIKLYCARRDKEWSLTDCLSFVTMQRESLYEALTGDHHFEQAGFAALLK